MASTITSLSLKRLSQNELCMLLMVGASFGLYIPWIRLGFVRNGLAPFEGKGIDGRYRTHRWQTRVPCGCVITAGTDANITVVHLGCTQAMRSPSVFQVFILLPTEAC